MKIVIPEFMDEIALKDFGKRDRVHYAPALVDDRPALLDAVADADALIVRNRTRVDESLLNAAPALRVVGRLGVGLDNIDVEACQARSISVYPAVGANTLAVAEYVIAMTLSLLRGAYASSAAMIAGGWPRNALIGGEASGRCMGLWGFGGIARAVARRARALDMTVAACDPYVPADDPAWTGVTRCTNPDELLARAEVLSLHVPLTHETRNMVDTETLTRMRPGAILINTARGGIVDEAALVCALRSGALGGAALDVFASEPLTAEAGARFQNVPNLVLTPHIAGVTGESNVRVSLVTVANVKREFRDA